MKSKIFFNKLWKRSYPVSVPLRMKNEKLTLPDILSKSIKLYPDKCAIISNGYEMTYSELGCNVQRMASFLSSIGVGSDTRVALILPNCIPLVVSCYSVMSLGAVFVMNNPMSTDDELENIFNDSAVEYLICLNTLRDRMSNLQPRTKIKMIISAGIDDFSLNQIETQCSGNIYRISDCIENDNADFVTKKLKWNQTACLQYTGGTSGEMKAVALTHKNLSVVLQNFSVCLNNVEKGKDTFLTALPIFHVYGMQICMNLSIYLGAKNVLLSKSTPEAILNAIKIYRVNYAPLVPTHFIEMLSHPELKSTDMSCIKEVISGGAPLHIEIIRRFKETTGVDIIEGYGMSEAASATHLTPYRPENPRKVGSIGVPIPNTDVRIVDLNNNRVLPVGKCGEMLIKGPQIASRYYSYSNRCMKRVKTKGWLHTGDIAYMDEDGYFYIVGRKKDVIISSAYKIYPREIEETFYSNPKVDKVAVIGIPDEKRGENVGVFLTLKKSVESTSEELMEFCKPKLAKYKWPALIEICDSLPENDSGKVLKYVLKNRVIQK